MTQHSILPPSSAARRVACPGSRALEASRPNEDTPEAREGVAAHWVAAAWAHPEHKPALPTHAPNGELITSEMLDGACEFRKSIHDVYTKWYQQAAVIINPRFTPPPVIHIEERVDCSTIHPDCYGTPDAWLYDPALGLHIWDYKYGHGFVEVFENWQLIEYAAGILATLGIDGNADQHTFVNFYIIQPRSFHRDGSVRRWVTRASDLRAHFNILRAAEAAALNPNAACHPSPECRYCRARPVCEALQRSALAAVDESGRNTPHDLNALATGNELRYLHHAAALLDARITGLEEQALAMIKRGDTVAHYHAEHSAGRMRWTLPVEQVAAIGALFGRDLLQAPKLITPRQAIDAGMDKNMVAQYSETPTGALKLVKLDTKQTRKLFGGET